jgi:hypothetical protein
MHGLWISCHSSPELLSTDLQSAKYHVFSDIDPMISTFNGQVNYYHYHQKNYSYLPINHLATVLKRLYTNNNTLLLRGDIIIYSSSDGFPHIIDDSIPYYFLQEIAMHTSGYNYV